MRHNRMVCMHLERATCRRQTRRCCCGPLHLLTPWVHTGRLSESLRVPTIPPLSFNSSWPSATYMRRDFQCLFPQRLRYVALISVLISPVPHTWGVTNGSLLASPPNSRRSPASLISPAPHICGASRTPILTRVVWKILNVVTNILVVLPDYRLP